MIMDNSKQLGYLIIGIIVLFCLFWAHHEYDFYKSITKDLKNEHIIDSLYTELGDAALIAKEKQYDKNFRAFIQRFNQDSLFQVSSIQFPLTYIYRESVGKEHEKKKIHQVEWKHISIDWGTVREEEEKYKILTYWDNHTMKVYVRGLNSGIYYDYHFLEVDDRWRLIKWEDFSH